MNTWHLLQSGKGDGAFNMALDEALFETAAQRGRPVLRVYDWTQPCATFGYSQPYETVAAATALRPLIRRITGGGLVPHGADWTYSLVFPPQHEWAELSASASYERLHAWLRDAFSAMQIEATLAQDCRRPKPGECFEGHELHDLLWRGRKIAGAAQRRNRNGLLIQGSVQPPSNTRCADWVEAMTHACGGTWVPLELNATLQEHAQELAGTKYSSTEHNQRR
ncbi:MAG: hypothetical protein EXS22_05450 [Pedosphaera sp.]|nr:hypothetical protein [Pedosphaera sp.]MSU43465.1 hypothetical protein [Pedosphaera sp.]